MCTPIPPERCLILLGDTRRRFALESGLQLTEGHWKVAALGEELPPLHDVRLQQSLLFLVGENSLLCLLYKLQYVLS